MWSFQTHFSTNNLTNLNIPKHFTFLILYILSSSLILCNFILPVTLYSSSQNKIQNTPPSSQTVDLKISTTRSKPVRAESIPSGKRRKRNHHQNVSRGSDPTQVWTRREEVPLFYHWISDMKEVWDEGREVFWPWPNSSTPCQTINVHFALENTFRPTALVSYPGSGNSWLRYLLELTTGIFTGSIFKDKSLHAAGLLGEFNHPVNNGRTILQKTHHDTAMGLHPPKFKSPAYKRRVEGMLKISQLLFGYRGILLVRNPLDAILSYWNYVHTKNHKAVADMDLNFPDFVVGGMERWAGLIQTWVKKSSDFLLVLYEDLVENPRRELLRILNYLHLPLEEMRMSCALEFLEGPFHRKHPMEVRDVGKGGSIQIHEWEHLFPIIQTHVDNTNEVLRQSFLPPLPYTFANSNL